MRTLILLALFMVCSVVQAAQTEGVAYNPTTFVVIQTNLTQTFETNNVTDELNVGLSGEQGVITLSSTNGTYSVTLSLDASGTLFVKYGTSNMLSLLVGTNSGHTGAGTKYLADGGAFVTPSSPIGTVTNINPNPTDGYIPFRSNANTFGDGPWYRISPDALGLGETNWYLVMNSTNTLIGRRSLYNLTTSASLNTSVGRLSLNALTTGTANTAVGRSSLSGLTSGQGNTAVGYTAGTALTTAIGNTLVGYEAGLGVTTGLGNTLFGYGAGRSVTTSNHFTAFGLEAGNNNLSGYGVVAGYHAGYVATNLRGAVIIGANAFSGERQDKNYENLIHIGYKDFSLTNNVQQVTNSIYIGANLIPETSNIAHIGDANVGSIYLPNSIHLDRSPTNVVFRGTNDMIYTNGAVSPRFIVKNGSGDYASLSLSGGGYAVLQSSSTTLGFVTSGTEQMALSSVVLQPQNNQNLGTQTQPWNDVFSDSAIYIYGSGTGSTDYERLVVDATTSTNGVTYNMTALGTGVFRNQTFQIGNTNIIQLNPSETANETGLLIRENGTMSRVKLGAAGTGPGGSGRALYVD